MQLCAFHFSWTCHANEAGPPEELHALTDGNEPTPFRYFEQGMVAVRDGRFEDALSSFEQAYELEPHPVVLFNIARANEKLRRWSAARDSYVRYLKEVQGLIDPIKEGDLEQRIRNLVELDLKTPSAPTQITHVERSELEVPKQWGEARMIRLNNRKEPLKVPPRLTTDQVESNINSQWMRAAGSIAMGVGAGLVFGGIATFVTAESQYGDWKERVASWQTLGPRDPSRAELAIAANTQLDQIHKLDDLAWGLLISSSLVTLSGVGLWFLSHEAPTLTLNAQGVGLRGTF